MRPPSTAAGSAYGSRPFAPAAFEAMKGQGYKVYLVSYRYARPVDGFGGFGGLLSGYGLRDFFGLEKGMGVVPSKVVQGQRLALVWETGRGECFLVDHYYATPVWLDGTDWLERVRFYDPAAVSVALERS